ncbi:MAG: TonB-dependent receptor [Bacteroidales bacterium]|nr:TonB-dependent receptor [Bacteroidales bacterium]
MMKFLKKGTFASLLLLQILGSTLMALGQATVTGTVTDSVTGIPVENASIEILDSKTGTTTDHGGNFSLTVGPGNHTLQIRALGFLSRQIPFTLRDGQVLDIGRVVMAVASIGLKEVNVIASEAVERKTPVAVSMIRAEAIQARLGDQPFPEIMKSVPGVYTSRTGGGSGDASVNIRGFKQENVALMLNGVPIGSVENGLVYWNNWLGLSEATRQIQVQRGLGASKVAMNSIGGTINIITKTTDIEPGGSLKYSLTDYGNQKTTLMLSSGRLKNNMAVTFLGSRFTGPGYVDATYVDGWAYYLSISKEFGKNHMLVFTALGNPERHGQRNFRLSKDEVDRYGLKYNKEWGSYNGKINNASENFYHKPHITLNHYWTAGKKSLLATSYYFSFGKGGGKWTDTFTGYPWLFSYSNPSGQVDWEAVYENNATNDEVYSLADGTDTTGYSLNVQTNFLASHIWTGLISTFQYEISDNLSLSLGIHGRLFKSKLQQKVRDLLGGAFYIDDYASALDGVAGRNQVKGVGDIIKIDNGAINRFTSLFGQLEYSSGRLNAFAAGTMTANWYQREDRYNYVTDIKSDIVFRTGFDVKAGLNYNIDEYHHLFLNAGYFSRAPYYKFVFGGGTNVPTSDLKNEKTLTAEAGYGLDTKNTRLRVNGYYTRWEDKSILTNEYNQFEDPSMVQGLDALHLGAEAELSRRIAGWLRMGVSLSFGNWKWKNDVTAFVYNDDMVVTDTINVFADGLYVGDAPQTTVAVDAEIRIMRTVTLNAGWYYFDRYYADFSPNTRTDPDDRSQPFRIPSYHLLDLQALCPFKIGNLKAEASLGCLNVLNNKYIVRGQDGPSHTINDFTGFWGFGRNFFAALKVNF